MSDSSGIAVASAAPNLLDTQSSHLIGKLRAQQSGQDESKIEKSARDFESILVSHWLEQAEQSFATVPGSDEDEDEYDDPGHSEFQSMAIQSLGSAVTSAGGIGIAKMIIPALRAANARQAGAEVPGGEGTTLDNSQIGTNARLR